MVMIETPMNIKGVTETFMLQQHQHRKEQAANSTSDLSLMNLPRTSSVRVAVSVTRSPPKRQTLQPLKPCPRGLLQPELWHWGLQKSPEENSEAGRFLQGI